DAHGGTYGFLYEDLKVDNGAAVAGIGHTVRRLRSISGTMSMYEGGIRCLWDDVIFLAGQGYNSNNDVRDTTFRNIRLYLTGSKRTNFSSGSSDITRENFYVENVDARGLTDPVDLDATVDANSYRAFHLERGHTLLN